MELLRSRRRCATRGTTSATSGSLKSAQGERCSYVAYPTQTVMQEGAMGGVIKGAHLSIRSAFMRTEVKDVLTRAGRMTPQQLIKVIKASADPTRFQLLQTIARRGETSCGEVVRQFPLAQATISRHLKALTEAGVVRVLLVNDQKM